MHFCVQAGVLSTHCVTRQYHKWLLTNTASEFNPALLETAGPCMPLGGSCCQLVEVQVSQSGHGRATNACVLVQVKYTTAMADKESELHGPGWTPGGGGHMQKCSLQNHFRLVIVLFNAPAEHKLLLQCASTQ